MAPTLQHGVWWTDLGVRLPREYMPHWPHPPQEAFLALPHQHPQTHEAMGAIEALYGGAARGGKSDALLMAALQYVDVPAYAALLLRRVSVDLHGADGLVPRSKEWLMPVLGEKAWNGERLMWTFPSGSTLRFGHMQYEDDKIKYQGQRYQFIGFDELTHFTETQYRYMFSRLDRPADGLLSQVPLRMRAASNPGGPGHDWVKRRFIDKMINPEDIEDTPEKARERAFIPSRVIDNPSVDRDAYVRSLSFLEPEVRAQLLDGNWDAREPGDWFFEDNHLAVVATLGRHLEALLDSPYMVPPSGGIVHLGVDWGQSTHALLGWPLETGGWFIAREFFDYGGEPSEKTLRMLALNEWGFPWGRVFFDAAGVQSQKTFNRVAEHTLGPSRPTARSIAFGATAPKTATTARKTFKGVGATYLRRLARRTGAGERVQVLAISPRCPELLKQLKRLQNNPEDPSGAWLKDDAQHGPDAAIALVAVTGHEFRMSVENRPRVAA